MCRKSGGIMRQNPRESPKKRNFVDSDFSWKRTHAFSEFGKTKEPLICKGKQAFLRAEKQADGELPRKTVE